MTDQGKQNTTTDATALFDRDFVDMGFLNSSTESGFVNVTKSPGVENWTTLATDVAAADVTDKLTNMDDFFNINMTNTTDYFSGDFVDVENSTVDSSIQDEAGYSTGSMTAKYSNQLALCYPTSEANMIGQLVGTFACIAVTWVYLVKTHRLMANQVHPQPVANQAAPLFPSVMQTSFRKALKRLFKDAVDFVWKHLTGHDVFGTAVVAFQRQDTFSQNAVTVGRSSETSPGDPELEDDIPLRDMSNPQCDRHGVRDTHAPDSTRTLAWQHPTGTTPSPDPSDAGEQGNHVHDYTTPTPTPDPSEAGGQGHHVHDHTTPTPDPSEAGEQEHHVHGHTTPTADPSEAEEQGNHVNGHTAPTPDPSEAGEQGHHVHGHTTRTPDPSEAGGQEHHVHGHTTRTPDPSEAGEQGHHVHDNTTPTPDPSEAGGQEHHVHDHTTPTPDPNEAGEQGNHLHDHTTPTPDPSEAGEQGNHLHGHTTPTADPSEAGGQGHHVHDHTTPTPDPSEAGEQEHHVHGHTTPTADPSEAGGQGHHVHDNTTPTTESSEAGEQEHHVHDHATPTPNPSEAGEQEQDHHVHDHTTPTPDPSEAGEQEHHVHDHNIPRRHQRETGAQGQHVIITVAPAPISYTNDGQRRHIFIRVAPAPISYTTLSHRQLPSATPTPTHAPASNTPVARRSHVPITRTTPAATPYLTVDQRPHGTTGPASPGTVTREHTLQTTTATGTTVECSQDSPTEDEPCNDNCLHSSTSEEQVASNELHTVQPDGINFIIQDSPAHAHVFREEDVNNPLDMAQLPGRASSPLAGPPRHSAEIRWEGGTGKQSSFTCRATSVNVGYKAKTLNIRPVHEIERQTICREENTGHRRPLHWGVSERPRSFFPGFNIIIKLLAVEKEPACRKL
ncbi:hypothetical protein Bbelb_115880 [Branchiostoma belcheri]|nr:hypothetical protein Bbelb_115880 [Branchiostoma belcheri]